MKKFKLFLNYEKEERWLADMASQGYQLKETDFGYSFEKTLPEQAVIKIDYRRFKKEQDFLDYLALFEDSGWQHISGTKKSGSQYFKKTNSDSTEDIFSDTASRAGRYKRLSDMWFSLFIPLIPRSESGKKWPMSLSEMAPRRASLTACISTSPSE